MVSKTTKPPKLTDAERYERFVAMAKEVGASDDPKDFDRVFEKVARVTPQLKSAESAKRR